MAITASGIAFAIMVIVIAGGGLSALKGITSIPARRRAAALEAERLRQEQLKTALLQEQLNTKRMEQDFES